MQLESFLETIGTRNVRLLGNIRISAPLWYRGLQEDYVEGAILDAMSPATRMAVIKPPARDRLLSAVQHSVKTLMGATSLKLAFSLEHPMNADHFTGRYINDKRLISLQDAQRCVDRKSTGVALLKQASDILASRGNRPVLTLCHFSQASKSDRKDFRCRLPGLIKEAREYGWVVHPDLEDNRRR